LENKLDLLSNGKTLNGFAQNRRKQLETEVEGKLHSLHFVDAIKLYKTSEND
jgi:hypothetical protein